MLSTVHPGDLATGSFQRSPKYLHSSAVWSPCHSTSPKTPHLSGSRINFFMGSAGITWHSRHRMCREPTFARRNGVLGAKQDSFNNTFFPFNEPILLEKKSQGKGDLANATSLHLVAAHSQEMMGQSVGLFLLGGLVQPAGCTVLTLKGTGCICSPGHSPL